MPAKPKRHRIFQIQRDLFERLDEAIGADAVEAASRSALSLRCPCVTGGPPSSVHLSRVPVRAMVSGSHHPTLKSVPNARHRTPTMIERAYVCVPIV